MLNSKGKENEMKSKWKRRRKTPRKVTIEDGSEIGKN